MAMRRHSLMHRAATLSLLHQCKPELQRRVGVLRLALFGSRARDDAREGSDADVPVALEGPADSRRYFGLQFYLEPESVSLGPP